MTLGQLTRNKVKEAIAMQDNSKQTEQWWEKGVRFQCQGSGKCCTSHGEFGYVFLTLLDRKRMANHLGLKTAEFTRKYCAKLRGAYHLKEDLKQPDCLFLKGKSCGIYEARPTQCRTWPFWPEVMNAKTWKKEVVAFCPGIGKGPLITAEKIREQLELQAKSEAGLR